MIQEPEREALIPHLAATLRMSWDNPPRPVAELLSRGLRSSDPACGRARQATPDLVAARCGREATDAIRLAAAAREPVTYPRMLEVQQLVTGPDGACFRRTVAHTAVRPERYAYLGDLESMFRRKVAADDQDACSPLLKAARLYLDVIFFHPFVDGNARAAMLWFTFHCLREGLPVPDFRRFHAFPFVPGDEQVNWQFCLLAINEVHGG